MDDELDTNEVIDAPALPFDSTTITFFIAVAVIPAFFSLVASKIILALPSSRRRPRQNASPGDLLTPGCNVNGRGHSSIPSTPRYGLALGETVSADEDSDAEIEDDVTARELRRLQQSPAFHAFLRNRRLTGRDLEGVYSRIRLYKKLKTLHPASFWMLCSPHSLILFETSEPGIFTLMTEYFLSSLINSAVFAALAWCIWTQASVVYWGVCIGAVWLCCGHNWLQGRPSAGLLTSTWYEDLIWGHGAPATRAALAQILETVYVLGTVGSGAVVSLLMRWKTGQSVGEKIVGVRLVVEKKVRLDEEVNGRNGDYHRE
jgi:hypothetical protein